MDLKEATEAMVASVHQMFEKYNEQIRTLLYATSESQATSASLMRDVTEVKAQVDILTRAVVQLDERVHALDGKPRVSFEEIECD